MFVRLCYDTVHRERLLYTERKKWTTIYIKMDWPVRSHFNRNMSLVVVRKTYPLIKVL